jgi:aminopeptidase N
LFDAHSYEKVETTNFPNIVEDISVKSLYRFFDQWIYGSGHPRLDIEFYLEHDMNKKKIRTTISQIIQQGKTHEWNRKKYISEVVYISQRKTEHWFEIPNSASIEWISIDPQFKLLKEIKSIKIINEINEFQIKERDIKKSVTKRKNYH